MSLAFAASLRRLVCGLVASVGVALAFGVADPAGAAEPVGYDLTGVSYTTNRSTDVGCVGPRL